MRKVRMGMAGGGQGAFIGAVHRMASALDGEIELVCGAFSSDPVNSAESGRKLHLAPERVYGSHKEMFDDEESPFNKLNRIADVMAELGYKGVQIPSWDPRCIDIKLAAHSQNYCDELRGKLREKGLEITELSTHLQGQLVAVHPAYNTTFDGFAPESLHGKAGERTRCAVEQLKFAAKASERLGLKTHATFSGSLLWHTVYPWPQRPAGLVETGFKELAMRWLPILNAFDEAGVDLCYEIHSGEDLHDGVSYERFLEATKNHPEEGAKEGISFVNDHIIRVTERACDDFADTGSDEILNRAILGLS